MERKGGWDRDVSHISRLSPQLFTFPPFLPHYHPLRPPLPPFSPPDLYAAIPPKKFTAPRAVKPPPKQRKPRTQKQKPADMSQADREKDFRQRRSEAAGPKERLLKLKSRQADVAGGAEEEAATLRAPRVGLSPPHGQHPLQGWMGSPYGFSPSSPAMFQETYGHATPRTRFSPSSDHEGYVAHSGFHPNLIFPSGGPPVYNGFDAHYMASPALRHGPLPFDSSAGASLSYQGGTDADSAFAIRSTNGSSSTPTAGGSTWTAARRP